MPLPISRRGVLLSAALGGGLLIAWGVQPRVFADPLPESEGEYNFGGWLRIAEDGVVSVAVPQLEMGQGVTTILPQIIATELGADWRQIAVEPAPVSGAYANVPLAAKWAAMWMPALPELATSDGLVAERFAQASRFVATADGTTLEAYETPCREAAATARIVLAMEAAARWGVEWEACDVQNGLVTHDGKSASFAALVEGAATRTAPDPIILRPDIAQERPLPGEADGATAFSRLDLPSKVDGSHLFAGDIRLPDMVYAAIKHAPIGSDTTLTRFDTGVLKGRDAVVAVVKGRNWLAVAATDWWSAQQAADAMTPRFDVTGAAHSERIDLALEEALQNSPSHRLAQRGEGDALMLTPNLAIRYDVSPAIHATIETTSATARLVDGTLELWMATQAPEQARTAAARAIGISVDKVILYPTPAGGSFDRRLEHDHAIEIALIAREVSKERPRPVQLVWSRWQEHLAGLPRTPVAAMMTARIPPGGDGAIDTMRARIAVPPSAREFGERLFANATHTAARERSAKAPDPLAVEGALPHYSGIPHAAVDHVSVALPLATGRMRGNAHGYTAFFVESFIDEIARRFGREPLSYRIGMLGGDLRMVACLQRAARLAQWDGGAEQSGQGLACHRIGAPDSGGRIACIATAKRAAGGSGSGSEAGVRVSKLVAAVDIGRIVNLDIARQQIEGGLIFGMGLALGAAGGYRDGLPTAQRLAQLDLPTLASTPEIEVDFIDSDEPAFDPGELGVAVAAPAIANALASATGMRFRRLPLTSEIV